MSWTQIATPHGPETRLRVECQSEPGKHGRYKLTAFDGDKAVHSAVYAWNVWMGHACGQLLMPEFIDAANSAAAGPSQLRKTAGHDGRTEGQAQ